MLSDAVSLFTECHGLYICGVRVAVRERMVDEHGDDWWDKGYWPILAQTSESNWRDLRTFNRPTRLRTCWTRPTSGR